MAELLLALFQFGKHREHFAHARIVEIYSHLKVPAAFSDIQNRSFPELHMTHPVSHAVRQLVRLFRPQVAAFLKR